jgi:hypothetical protein
MLKKPNDFINRTEPGHENSMEIWQKTVLQLRWIGERARINARRARGRGMNAAVSRVDEGMIELYVPEYLVRPTSSDPTNAVSALCRVSFFPFL